jgi:hypothetical protein
MAKKDISKSSVVIGLTNNRVIFLYLNNETVVCECENVSSNVEWGRIINVLFNKHKVSYKTKVKVILDTGLYSSAQLPKNSNLTEEELRGIAMYKDLEGVAQGRVADFTWDFYDTKTSKNSKPSLTFVLVEKKIISLISEIIAPIGVLEEITVKELAMAEFISHYQSYLGKNGEPVGESKYLNQLCLALYMPKDAELSLFAIYQGEICYTRVLRGYKDLSGDGTPANVDVLISKLTTEIYRLSDDFLTSQLGLPPMSKLLLMLDCGCADTIAKLLCQNFKRVVELIPKDDMNNCDLNVDGYSCCENKVILEIVKKGYIFLPLYGIAKEGVLVYEKD